MLDPFLQMLHDWQNFYMLTGTASATLVGLMFVAATFGANQVPQDNRMTVNTWVTPAIVHFVTALVFAIFMAVPTMTREWLGLLLAFSGIAGLAYIVRVGYRMWHRKTPDDFESILWHIGLPFISHVFVLSTAISLLSSAGPSLNTLAIASTLLLIVGIRNTWDMTVWIAENRKE